MFKIHFNLCRKEETRVLTYTGITVNNKKAGNLALIFKKEAAL